VGERERDLQRFLLFPPLAAQYRATPDKYSEPYTRSGEQNRDVWGTTARLDWTTDAAVLTSITSFPPTTSSTSTRTWDSTLADAIDRGATEENEAFSQELRLGNTTNRLSWIAGLYYLHESTDRFDNFVVGPDDTLSRVFNRGVGFTNSWTDAYKTDSYAVFGQATLDLGRKVKLTLGGRYSYDEKSMDIVRGHPGECESAPAGELHGEPFERLGTRSTPSQPCSTGSEPTPRPTRATAKASRAAASNSPLVDRFGRGASDHLRSRVRQDLGGRRQVPVPPTAVVSLSGALFYNDYRNMQFPGGDGDPGGLAPLTIITNAGQSPPRASRRSSWHRPATGLELSPWLRLRGRDLRRVRGRERQEPGGTSIDPYAPKSP